jgi:hypothetical protein
MARLFCESYRINIIIYLSFDIPQNAVRNADTLITHKSHNILPGPSCHLASASVLVGVLQS